MLADGRGFIKQAPWIGDLPRARDPAHGDGVQPRRRRAARRPRSPPEERHRVAGPGVSGRGTAPASTLLGRDLRVSFGTKRGVARVVNGVSYDVAPGETVAIVGESGSGKSVGVMALMGLVPQPPGRVTGEAWFEGHDLVAAPERVDALDPRQPHGDGVPGPDDVAQPGAHRRPADRRVAAAASGRHARRQAADRAAELLDLVGIPSARAAADATTRTSFSGGMRQRVMIAMGLATEPVAPDRRRADHRPRRHDPGPDRRARAGAPAAARDGDRVDHPRPRGGRRPRPPGVRDVRRADHRGRDGRRRHVVAPPPLHEGAAWPRCPRPGADRPERLFAIPGLPPDPVHLPPGCAFWERCTYRLDEREQRRAAAASRGGRRPLRRVQRTTCPPSRTT